MVTTLEYCRRVCSKLAKRNVRSRAIGPLEVAPYCPWVSASLRGASGLRASKRWLRKKPYSPPCQLFVPDCVTMFTMPPDGAAKFGNASGSDHLKLAHNLLAEISPGQICRVVICRQTVDDKAVAEVSLTGD